MTVVSVLQLADAVGIPKDRPDRIERLIKQLNSAGIQVSTADDMITEKQKEELLAFLKREHGEAEGILQPKKITLNRKVVSEIKVQRASGRKGTVSVVRKKRHVYENQDAKPIEEEKVESTIDTTPITQTVVETARTEAVSGESINHLPNDALANPVSTATTEVAGDDSANSPEERAKLKARALREIEEEEKGKNKPKQKSGHKPTRDQEWRNIKSIKTLDLTLTPDLDVEEVSEEIVAGRTAAPRRPIKAKARPILRDTRGSSRRAVEEIQKKHGFERPTGPVIKEVLIPEILTVAELAQKMSVKATEVMKVMIKMGTMATINQPIDQDTAVLVVEEMGHTAKRVKDSSVEESVQNLESHILLPRGPVVTVMGHVDHGKTSLLDYIRTTRVALKEAGGITQHIGAYHVETNRGPITFLDTPGHAAFSSMRARGVKCTDIVVLVVAADDGVMPQTIEAIQHAKAAQVPIIVAITKIDKGDKDLDRLYNELSQHGLISEAWGGEVLFVPVSSKEGTGIDTLLESIALQAEILELKAPVDGPATGVVIEARLDKGRGPIASLLVQTGTLKRGDILLAGNEFGRVRAMINELGQQVTSVGPGMPVEILGLSNTPQAGDSFIIVKDERKAREVAQFRQSKQRDLRMLRQQASKLEGFFDRMQQGEGKTLKVVLKADVQGSQEALSDALESLSTDQVKVNIIASGVGGINESDVTLAMASEAIMIGFNVRADAVSRRLAEQEGVSIYYHSVIYDVVNEVKRAVNGLIGPQFKEKIVGLAEVRDVFKSPKLGAIAGCMVTEGSVKRGNPIRVLRNNVVIYQGELESLRRFKEDASEVRSGTECGIGVKNYNDVKVGDQIEVYEVVTVANPVS